MTDTAQILSELIISVAKASTYWGTNKVLFLMDKQVALIGSYWGTNRILIWRELAKK